MGSKKQIIAIVLLSVLLGGGAVGYSWHMGQTRASTFPGAGYVHIADPEQEVKQLAFQGGAVWHRSLSDTVSFTDTQGVQQKISAMSFAHFDDRSLTALSRGVVVDLNDLDTARMTNYYALAPTVTFANTGSGYTLQNSSTELSLNDFLWKISEDKYMLVSQGMELNLSEEDAREIGDYVEITYVDEGVIQLQTVDNVWQTVSDVCFVNLNSGNVVDLALRHVRNENGEVLMDFSKMVVDSNSNIEVTPLTEELKNVKESVIPHFEITAKDGEDGEDGAIGAPGQSGAPGEAGAPGDPGENGESGEDGKQGAPGEAGENGAAGASGTNGAAGAPGKAGEAGEDGKEPPAAITTEVLSLPEFTLKDWTPTATGCQGTIMVQDKGRLLVSNGTLDKDGNTLNSRVYVVDALTGLEVGTNSYTADSYTFDTTAGGGYPFQFTGLAPDREYMLVVEAPLDTQTGSKGPYLRTFISKSFFTDSVGVYLEAEPSGTNDNGDSEVNLKVHTQDYAAGTVSKATVYLFASESVAAGETLESLQSGNSTTILQQVEVTIDPATGESGMVTLSYDTLRGEALAPNTTYYARVVATVSGKKMLPAQVLPLTTLKRRAELGTPILTANRNNWGFDLTAGGVKDPDSGITGYQWEIIPAEYKEKPENCPPELKKTVKADLANSVTVPLDNDVLKPEEDYVVRLVAQFHDNEKSYSITSEWSNAAKVMGGELPLVTFTPKDTASSDKEDVNKLNTDAGYYDQIVGTINVLTTKKSVCLLLDADHPAKVTVYAAGYYRKELPVYLRDGDNPVLPSGVDPNGKYLLGYREQDGTVRILVDEGALKDLQAVDDQNKESTPRAVNGLFPDMAYRLIVSGDLSNDASATNKIEENITVGACVVETEKLEWTGVSLTYNKDNSADRVGIAESKLLLFTHPMDQEGIGPIENVDERLLDRQKKTLSSVTIRALRSASGAADEYTPLTLTSDNYIDTLTNLNLEDLNDLLYDEKGEAKSLGELMAGGLPLYAKMFGTKYENDIQNASAAIIQVSMVQDYTYLTQNRQNWESQKTENGVEEYLEPIRFPLACGTKPESEADRKLAEAANANEESITFTIPLNPMPEPIPDAGQGFIREEGKDSNNDGSFDTFELEPNFANGAKLARYITYYVFDRPDYQEVDYSTPEWTFDPKYDPTWKSDNLNENWAEKEDPGHPEYQVHGPRYQTPVTSVTTDGTELKGTWLAKLRVPVPTQGVYANQIPKVNFIAMTATDYYTELGERTNQSAEEAGLKDYQETMAKLAADPEAQEVADKNTWNMFYPEGSTQPTTGHQFIFAWTLEWVQTDSSGNTSKKYYPFEMPEFLGTAKGDYIKKIPHSHVKDVPHPEPEVYAMPWKQDTRNSRIIQWDLTINDPAGAVVPSDSGSGAILYEMWSAIDASPLYVGNHSEDGSIPKTQVTVYQQSRAKDAVHGPEYQAWLNSVKRDRASIFVANNNKKDSHQVGLMLQRYTNRYLVDDKRPLNPGGQSALAGDPNGYTHETELASNINGGRAIPYYVHAFSFNFSEAENADKGKPDPGQGIHIVINRDDLNEDGLPNGNQQNQYNVEVTGDNLAQVNGIRLQFGDDVVLDKYLYGYSVDKVEEGTSALKFRVHIDKELYKSTVAGQNVPFSASVLYETGAEGYSYVNNSANHPAGEYPLGLRENRSGRADGMWVWKYLRFSSSGTATVGTNLENTKDRPPRMGSMFQIVWLDEKGLKTTRGDYGWPYGIGLIPTRVDYMSELSSGVRANGVGIETLAFNKSGVARTNEWLGSTPVNIPRELKVSTVPVRNISGSAIEKDGLIHVPSIRPFIVYNDVDSESFANYMNVVFNVNQNMKNNLYFTLEKDFSRYEDGSEFSMLTYDYNGKKWVDRPTADLGQSNETTVNGSAKDKGIFFNCSYTSSKQQDVMQQFVILEPGTLYRIRAYYKEGGEYKLLKETNKRTGENKPENNAFVLKTGDAPEVSMDVYYQPLDYQQKIVRISPELRYVEKYYYTLELQDEAGNFITYMNCYFNYAPTVSDPGGTFNVGQNVVDLNGLPLSDEITPKGLVKTEPEQLVHLDYGKKYFVVMRAYNQDTGPAYNPGQDREKDDLLSGKISGNKAVPFVVTDKPDKLSLYGKYDLSRDENGTAKPTVTFTRAPAKESRLIWQDKLAPVIIWEHDGQYTDVTEDAVRDGIVKFSSGDIKLDVSDNKKYKEGDQFHCFMFGVMDSGTKTSGIPDLDSPQDREFILGSLADKLRGPLDKDILSELRGFAETTEAGTGNRVLLASSVTTHRGTDTNAGVVSVNWHPVEANNVLVTLTDSVELSAIRKVFWSITATFDSESGSSRGDHGDIDLQSELNGGSFAISPTFAPAIPGDAKNITYTITLYFTKEDGTQVGLSASQNDNAAVQDNVLSCKLPPRNVQTNTFSALFRSIRDFFAAPFRKED